MSEATRKIFWLPRIRLVCCNKGKLRPRRVLFSVLNLCITLLQMHFRVYREIWRISKLKRLGENLVLY